MDGNAPLPPGRAAALARTAGRAATPAELERAVADLGDPALARWAFAQWDLRRRAAAKFPDADRLFFEREALEQATHGAVAAWRAARFPADLPVADLTTGLGADLMALAARGPARGFELEPERAALAWANLAARGLDAPVEVRDALAWLSTPEGRAFPGLWADPARRVAGRRTLRLEEFSPDPRALAEAFAGRELAGMKLSPMLADADLEALGERVEFVSYGGECREAAVWRGRLVAEGGLAPGRWAVRAEDGTELPAGPPPPPGPDPAPGGWLYDADPAAIRAHALAALAARWGLTGWGEPPGFLTGPVPADDPWLRGGSVVLAMPFDRKRLRAAFRATGLRPQDVKPRGVPLDPAAVRREVDPGSGGPCTLWVVRTASGVRAAATIAAART